VTTADGYTDTHCHLYDTRGVPQADVIAAAHAAGVTTMITVGCDAATTASAIETARAYDGIYATAGLHPHEAVHGVDYYYDHSPRDVQRAAFAAQIQLAHERRLPLIVHTRDAWADTFDVFAAEGVPASTIFHCFTGGPEEAQRCLDLGAYLSFSGIVTFKSATELHAAARLCPADRLLAETDSPYLAPVPHRGRPNQPAYVTHVVAALAALRTSATHTETTDSVRAVTSANARLAFPAVGP
jgi:TatD DNase family protein